MSNLTFNNINLTPVKQTGGIYLTSSDLANALGYKSEKSVSNLYNANKDEFTAEMTQVIEVPEVTESMTSKNLMRTQRIFSLRGAHLVAMFSRTEIAKDFRKWVLDVLDKETGQAKHQDTLTHSEQQTLRELISRKLAHLDEAQRKKAYPQIWERIKNKFRVAKYEQLQRSELADVIVYISAMELKGFAGQANQQACLISAEQKRQIEAAMQNVTRYFTHKAQKASTNLHKIMRQKHGYAKLDQMTTDQLPLVLADLRTIETIAHQYNQMSRALENQFLHWVEHQPAEQVNQLLETQKTALGLIAA